VGVGTDQIGRFDIEVDDDTNSIVSYKWQLVPITNKIAKPDKDLEDFISSFQKDVDRKYNVIVSKFSEKLTHPVREEETMLGNLVADAFAEMAETDIMLVGSGSIRVKELGPLVTLKDFLACFPYDDALTRFEIPGSLVAKIFRHIMRKENRTGEGECYQVNGRIKAKYNDKTKSLDSLLFDGFPIDNEKFYKVCMQNFHFNNSPAYLGVSNEELIESGKQKVVTTSAQQVLEEWLKNHQNEKRNIEKRLEYTD
jgi:5'-nucleotidase/UDP-sugar diphosphatase